MKALSSGAHAYSAYTHLEKARKYVRNGCLAFIRVYQAFLSPYLGGACRFHPTCSHYAVDVLRTELQLTKALALVVKRILRCRPGGPSGYDPAPGEFTT